MNPSEHSEGLVFDDGHAAGGRFRVLASGVFFSSTSHDHCP
jgi:hypothetical protein